MKLLGISKWVIGQRHTDNEPNIIIRKRMYIYVFTSLLLVIGIPINLLGIAGPQTGFVMWANTLHVLVTILLFVLFRMRKLSLLYSIVALSIISQLELIAENIYFAMENSVYGINLILGNMSLLIILQLFTVIGYIPRLSYWQVGATILCYIGCIFLTHNYSLINMFLIFVLVLLMCVWMGELLIKTMLNLYHENTGLKAEQQSVLDYLQIDKKELSACMALAKSKELSPEETRQILTQSSIQARNNITQNVRRMIEQESIDYELLDSILPMLSKGEREICRLILQGKTIAEISKMTEKSISNITCRRTHIRSKLNLEKGDNLRQVLIDLMPEQLH